MRGPVFIVGALRPERVRHSAQDMPVLKFCSVMSDAIEDAIQLR